jgi:hypothetical protein
LISEGLKFEEESKVEEEDEGIVFAKKERRSYVFVVKYSNEELLINKN